MIYNIDFLIASLIFLFVILYHFMQQQALYMQDNHSFLWVIFLGISNIVLDIICTALITWPRPEWQFMTEFTITVLYCLQILVPSAIVNHVFGQIPATVGKPKGRFIFTHLLPGLMLTMIISNHWTNEFFTVTGEGIYQRSDQHFLMYLFGGAYLLIAALTCVVHRKHLSRFKRYAIWEMALISGVTILFQSIYHNILLTGFGITLAITVLFFTLNNPYHCTDSLTNTFDVRYFRERARGYIEHRKPFHVLMIELSQLKRINHVAGAGAGNNILRITANMLRSISRQNLVFRITGKRFVVIATSLSLYEEARSRILQFFSQPVDIGDRSIPVPVTVCGILNAEELKDCDTLQAYGEYLLTLVTSPHKGAQLIQNTEETLEGFRYTQAVDKYLTTAIEKDLFQLNYQPVYSADKQKFTSMEILSRLKHPDLGPISPDIFIRLAEKNDLIPKIGLLQLRRACRFIKENPIIMQSLDSVKVNLSPVELMRPGHVDLLIHTIQEAGLPTTFFQFEITETVATEYSSSLRNIASKFTKAGIELCLDDFGSGYANLNAVFRLPFSTIKLDRSLLMDICYNPRAAALYQGLASAIHAMHATIIAEGVETEQELEKVTACGVNKIQGFYFSRPLPPEKLIELLKDQQQKSN